VSEIRLLLISGSTRDGSSNTLALARLHELDHPGVSTDLYDGLTRLPAFIPDWQPVPPSVGDLLARILAADAVVFSTPEYAGGLPGSLKNLLDWTVGGGELYGKPVAWLDVAHPGRGGGARAQLRSVLGYVGGLIVEAACVRVAGDHIEADAAPAPTQEQQLTAMCATLIAAVRGNRDAQTAMG
jgi:NAD(P)H-dependent FMN reductase